MSLAFRKIYFLFSFLLFLPVFGQYTVPEKPSVLYPVYDEVGLLTKQQAEELNQKLIRFEDSTSTEIEVIIIPSTKGEDINFVAWQFGEAWQIGKKEVNNGVILLVASEDRTISIQQGRAVEQYLTASVAGQIIDYLIAPSFREGNYYEGIDRGTTAIMESVQGQFKPIVKNSPGDSAGLGSLMLTAIVVVIILIIIARNSGGGSGGNYREDDRDVILSKRGRRSYPGGFFPFPPMGGGLGRGGGGFGGGGFGGGFGGFGGGGSFGGGGASGGW